MTSYPRDNDDVITFFHVLKAYAPYYPCTILVLKEIRSEGLKWPKPGVYTKVHRKRARITNRIGSARIALLSY